MPASKERTHPFVCTKALTLIVIACFLPNCAIWDGSADSPAESIDAAEMDSGSDVDLKADTVGDVAVDDAGDGLGAFAGCQSALMDRIIDLDFSNQMPQFQPRAAFDGSAIWVVYARNASAEDDERDIYAARISCDGEIQVALKHLNTQRVFEIFPSPSIDIQGDTVHFVWDTKRASASTQNIVAYRTFHIGGEPKMAEERLVEFDIDQEVLSGFSDFFYADVVGLSEGDALIAATAKSNLQLRVIVQRISDMGVEKGRATLVLSSSSLSQIKPSIAADASDRIWLAWQQSSLLEPGDWDYFTVYRSFNLNEIDVSAPVTKLTLASPQLIGSIFAKDILDTQKVFLVQQTKNFSIRLLNAASSPVQIDAGTEAFSDIYPAVATAGAGGALAWYHRDTSPLDNDRKLYVQTFQDVAGQIQMDAPIEITSQLAARHTEVDGAPGIVSIGAGYYFVVSHEGDSRAETLLRGRFISPDSLVD